MTADEFEIEDREHDEVDALLTDYVAILLSKYDELLGDEDASDKEIGSVRIIIDDGKAQEHINRRCKNHGTLLLSMPTLYDANVIEYRLAQWAIDYGNLEAVVMSLRPGSRCPDYDEYIANATEEVSSVLINALVIPPKSYMGINLRRAVTRKMQHYC